MFQAVSGFFSGGGPKGEAAHQSLHDFEVKDIEGNTVQLSQFKGQVVLVVNLASACGLTPQYAELQKLQEKYHARGFTVLGFPCNQFAKQEPGSNSEVKRFATSKYNVTFPLMSKVDVNGEEADPVFVFLKQSKAGTLGGVLGSDVSWNFSKFLVGKDGKVVQRYAPMTSPASVAADIEKLL